MNATRTLIGACALALGSIAFGQNEEDALRYSNIFPGGTARSWAMAGAVGAVGADPAAATTNPAGFGLYNASELSITLGFESNTADATYYGTNASASQQRMSMNNMALVLNYPNEGGDWRGGTFGLSYDRQASFHWKEYAKGDRVPSTILQRFVNEANGAENADLESFFPFTGFLAWQTYGMDTIPGTTDQYAPAIPFGDDTRQEHSIDGGGRISTTNIFYANNYKDRIYLGIAVGIVGTKYERYTIHDETYLDGGSNDIKTLRYKEDLLTTGNGVDVKIGVIGRATDRLRLGASFHSPMWLQLNDAYSYEMITAFNDGDGFKEASPTGTFSYRVTTPWRLIGSAVYQAGKHGLVSLDYTYADMRASRLRSSRDYQGTYDYTLENDLIRNSFIGTHSLRVGTEWRSGPWYFRAGWAFQPDPYADNDARHGTAYRQFSGGLGIRATHWSLDLTGVYGSRDGKYFQYTPTLVQPTSASYTDFRTLVTFAMRP